MIDLLDGRRRGGLRVCVCVCGGGGGGLSSNSVNVANDLIYKAYNLQRYSDKTHRWTRVRVCIVCMSQYMRFGLITYLQKPLIIIYFGVFRGTRYIKVVWSLL